jgi:alkaline phosphatase
MRTVLAAAAGIAIAMAASAGSAQTVYPIDRADILSGARFDFKVEFAGLVDPARISVTLNGQDYAQVFGKAAAFVEREAGKDQSALTLRDVVLPQPGTYKVRVTDGVQTRELNWNVYDTPPRKAKNVILFIGDGMSLARRVAARVLAKGIAEGKAFGKLAIDDMPQMALVATAGSDSIITDSANSASAYATGHKTAVNAMGVYADRTPDPLDDPKVETITSLAKRRLGMAVGIVTNTEVEDATPAAMVAHIRRRSEYDRIVEQFFAAKPDVIMGGGRANFLPRSAEGSKRKDESDFVGQFRDAGYSVASTGAEMTSLADDPKTTKLVGLFTLGNMDGALDRKILKGGTVGKFPEQPDLTEEVGAALKVLSRNEAGFFLMVESGMIDKYTHLLDMERAVYDTIMLDNAVKLARDWATAHGDDTLILVLADHTHPIGLVGTIEDDMASVPNVPMRERVRVYERAGFPNYPPADAEGYPARVDVSRRLALFSASLPDHYETFRPKLDNPNEPTVAGKDAGTYVANERYKNVPGSVLRFGNLPAMINADVHSGEDVVLTASGPGSERVRGQMDNTEVFRVMVEALAGR